jgi:hypothetical protein
MEGDANPRKPNERFVLAHEKMVIEGSVHSFVPRLVDKIQQFLARWEGVRPGCAAAG